MPDGLEAIRSYTEWMIEEACIQLDAGSQDAALAWGTIAAAKATLYLAEVIRAQGNGQPQDLKPEIPEEMKEKCAFCEGEFPESALNYSSGNPACAPCQKVFDPKPPPRR